MRFWNPHVYLITGQVHGNFSFKAIFTERYGKFKPPEKAVPALVAILGLISINFDFPSKLTKPFFYHRNFLQNICKN